MTAIRWGILGTGSIAKAFAEAIQETEGDLIAVASNTKQRAEEFVKDYQCEPVEGYHNLISNPAINAVYVATPHTSHFELSAECLRNKKAVLCEKPMTMNATETMALIDLSRKHNTLLMEAFMYKIHPQTQKIISLVKDRLQGPLQIKANFCFSVDVPETHRLVNKDLGGGSILDIGCYPTSISRYVVGAINNKEFMNPISFKAEGELNSQGIDLNASAKLKFEDGSVAEIKSATNKQTETDVIISDSQLSLIVNQPWHCGEFTERKSDIIVLNKDGTEEKYEIETEKGLYALQIDHFSELFNNRSIESSLIPHNDSHGNMISLDSWRKELKVFYKEDRGETRKTPIIPLDKPRESLPISKIPGINKDLSRVVFGCDNQSDSNHAFAMFDHFFSQGGNVFDTAYIYNEGKSDLYLGSWIDARGLREEVVVLGKGAHTPDCTPDKIRPQLDETLSRMSASYLDIYCLHRDNEDLPVEGFIDTLNELKDEGLVSVFGASNWSLKRFKEANDYALSTGKEPFTVLSNNFSLAHMNNPVWPGCFSCSEDDYLKYLTDNQISIFPWSSQARGFFLDTQEFTGLAHVADPNREEQDRVWGSADNLERRKRCFDLAAEKDVDPIQMALAFVLNQDFPSFPLIGPRNFFETASSLQATQIEVSSEEISWLNLKS
ncbi:MAG: aldo/keto reductase [SAR86 cluster bacterium]|nr:aldo/keto reductase [SAR86 cluster bacterium]